MQAPGMQQMIDGLSDAGTEALDAGAITLGLLTSSSAGVLVALTAINTTLEEIRDALKDANRREYDRDNGA